MTHTPTPDSCAEADRTIDALVRALIMARSALNECQRRIDGGVSFRFGELTRKIDAAIAQAKEPA